MHVVFFHCLLQNYEKKVIINKNILLMTAEKNLVIMRIEKGISNNIMIISIINNMLIRMNIKHDEMH